MSLKSINATLKLSNTPRTGQFVQGQYGTFLSERKYFTLDDSSCFVKENR